ncbi:Bah and tfiis domain-containing protein [Thalictrum thalictroides]|uniref:Bah and tfiis domain-containing protein n=1 Tax=Thalictrum thalictroides TaxID=46969 RepID=A0A7J6W498_THATH|nr:Bah and tfiis domain-containing protein [Thalictrum thalictroides]
MSHSPEGKRRGRERYGCTGLELDNSSNRKEKSGAAGRKISVGDCALFKPPQDTPPPFIGLIRYLSSDREDGLWLGVNWLYRPAEVKLAKGSLLEAAPNEIFYSFHKDEIPAASLLHPCKVAFLRKGVELPLEISSFVCRRLYDTTNKCLWWLTDRDYTNERQEEVDQLLDQTQVEMHAQSGVRSPKPLNGPMSVPELKPSSDSVQNSSTLSPSQVRGKKRERVDQGPEPIKRERYAKTDNVDIAQLRPESILKCDIAEITNKGLLDFEGVEKLVQLMQLDKTEKKLDLVSRIKLADVLSSTEKIECLGRFVQLRGLSVLDEWLQEVHKGKLCDSSLIKESDNSVDELLFALLRALDKLPINLHALQTSNVGKSVNNLRSHKNLEIQKKARSLVDTWKKRVEAEMKINDAKSASSQAMSWPSKQGFTEVSQGGNRVAGVSSAPPVKSSVTPPSAYKTVSVKPSLGDGSARLLASPRSAKTSTSFPAPVTASSKDLKEDRSSSSSQSNSQSCSSEHIKTVGSVWKEDARSSTAGSPNVNKSSTSTSRHKRSGNGILAPVSGDQKDVSMGKSVSLNRTSTSEKISQSGLTCDRKLGLVDHGNNQRLIVRLPNSTRSPAPSASGCSHDNPSVMSTRVSSPGPEKHAQYDQKVKGKSDFRSNNATEVNAESWQSNDVKDVSTGSDKGDASPATGVDEEPCRSGDDNGIPLDSSRPMSSSTRREKGVSSRGLSSSKSAGDDGMNLLASVAAGEMSASDLGSPVGSLGRTSPMPEDSCTGNDSRPRLLSVDVSVRSQGKADDGANPHTKKQVESIGPSFADGLHVSTSAGGSESIPPLEEEKTLGTSISVVDLPQVADPCSKSDGESDKITADVSTAGMDGREQCEGANKPGEDRKMCATGTHGIDVEELGRKVKIPLSDCNKTFGNTDEKTAESNVTVASDIVRGSRLEVCGIANEALNERGEKKAVEESISSQYMEGDGGIKKHVHEGFGGDISAEQRLTGADDKRTTNVMLTSVSDSVLISDGLNEPNSENVKTGERTLAEQKMKNYMTQANNVSSTFEKLVGSGDRNDVEANDISEQKESYENYNGVPLPPEEASANPVEETEVCVKSSGSKVSGVQAEETEECASNAEASSVSVGLEKANKLDFDLNEDFPADDGNQDDSVSSTAPGYIPSVHLPNPSIFPTSLASSLTGLITVAAAKGSFVPPEKMRKSTVELGWRGSAATSAFRPAEPRKFFDMTLSTDHSPDSLITKHSRPLLDFDLNVADERVFEDNAFQSSAQAVSTEVDGQLGALSYRDLGRSGMFSSPTPVRSVAGLDLDLNRVDESSDPRQLSATTPSAIRRLEVPLLPLKASSSSIFYSDGMTAGKDFDLNNGPVLDEVGSEPVHRGQHAKSSFIALPPVADLRMSKAELGSVSSWFPQCNSYQAVAMPSILPGGGEQSYSIVPSAETQRLLGGPVTSSNNLGPDVYRGPVFSSSAALPFSSPNLFPYPGFSYNNCVPVPSTTFSGSSATYLDSSSAGGVCFPAFPSQFLGHAGAVSAPYPRPYVLNLSDGSSVNVGADSSSKWGRQGLDLNAGPGSTDKEVREGRFSSMSRQLPVANSVEEHMRMYQAASGSFKRKEPEGGWDLERFGHKQPSWH